LADVGSSPAAIGSRPYRGCNCAPFTELTMMDSARLTLEIDRAHARAIRREIGERLRRSIDAELGPPPAQLRLLLERLAQQDRGQAKAEVAA